MTKPTLVVTRRLYQDVFSQLASAFNVIADNQADDQPWDLETMRRQVAQADYLLCSVADKVDASVIAAATRRVPLGITTLTQRPAGSVGFD